MRGVGNRELRFCPPCISAFLGLMGTGRKPDPPGSEMEDSLTWYCRQQGHQQVSSSPSSPRALNRPKRVPMWAADIPGEEGAWAGAWCFTVGVNTSALCSRGRYCLHLPRPSKHPGKDGASAGKMCRTGRDPGTPSPNNPTHGCFGTDTCTKLPGFCILTKS